MNHEDILSRAVLGAAIEVHRHLGPGLLESAYEACLAHEIALRNIPFERQKILAVPYKGVSIDAGFRLDFLVDDCLIVELKAVEHLLPVHQAQVLTYLKLTGCHLGFLINFNTPRLGSGGIKRVARDLR